jgi:hypothetical protein
MDIKYKYYGKLYYTEAEYIVKYPYLKAALKKYLKKKREYRKKKRIE